eukprot:3941854-Pleurochrysis_carterae.AAC.1
MGKGYSVGRSDAMFQSRSCDANRPSRDTDLDMVHYHVVAAEGGMANKLESRAYICGIVVGILTRSKYAPQVLGKAGCWNVNVLKTGKRSVCSCSTLIENAMDNSVHQCERGVGGELHKQIVALEDTIDALEMSAAACTAFWYASASVRTIVAVPSGPVIGSTGEFSSLSDTFCALLADALARETSTCHGIQYWFVKDGDK